MRNIALASIIISSVACVACGPADVAGNYTVNLTNGPNDCAYDFWAAGDSTSGISLVVTQDEDQVAMSVEGATGVILDVGVGGSQFNGQVGGNDITAALIGDVTRSEGECVYTITVDADASLDGDLLEGELLWRPLTNGHPDCGILDSCEGNRQSFNGTRPPAP